MADKAQTWVYTEDYVAESDALTAARVVAAELGATPVSSGTGAALQMLAASVGAGVVLAPDTEGVGAELLAQEAATAVSRAADHQAAVVALAIVLVVTLSTLAHAQPASGHDDLVSPTSLKEAL